MNQINYQKYICERQIEYAKKMQDFKAFVETGAHISQPTQTSSYIDNILADIAIDITDAMGVNFDRANTRETKELAKDLRSWLESIRWTFQIFVNLHIKIM